MQIQDLPIPALTNLSTEELLALILSIRERRRLVAKSTKVTKTATHRSKKNPLSTMTKEQLEKLLEALTNGYS